MALTLSFPAWRRGFLKITAPVISAAIARGHDVVLLTGPIAESGEAVSPGTLQTLFPDARIACDVAWDQSGVLIAPALDRVLRQTPTLVGWGETKLVSLDNFWFVLNEPLTALHTMHQTCYATEHQRRTHHARLRWPIDERTTAVVGTPAFDPLVAADLGALRTRYRALYGLGDAPVVLFLTAKLKVPGWRRRAWSALGGYRRLLETLRETCDRLGAKLVVKSRQKHGDPPFVRELAHAYIAHDVLTIPYPSLALMALADRCIHFQSGAVFEAVACGVPSLALALPVPHLRDYPSTPLMFSREPGTPQAWAPGVSETVSVWRAARTLADLTLGARDTPAIVAARTSFLEQHVGPLDGKASERVLDLVERL